MATLVQQKSATTDFAGNQKSVNVVLDSTATAGNLLLAFFTHGGHTEDRSVPTHTHVGWDTAFDENHELSDFAGPRVACFYRVASGNPVEDQLGLTWTQDFKAGNLLIQEWSGLDSYAYRGAVEQGITYEEVNERTVASNGVSGPGVTFVLTAVIGSADDPVDVNGAFAPVVTGSHFVHNHTLELGLAWYATNDIASRTSTYTWDVADEGNASIGLINFPSNEAVGNAVDVAGFTDSEVLGSVDTSSNHLITYDYKFAEGSASYLNYNLQPFKGTNRLFKRVGIPTGITVWLDQNNDIHEGRPGADDEAAYLYLGGKVHTIPHSVANLLAAGGYTLVPTGVSSTPPEDADEVVINPGDDHAAIMEEYGAGTIYRLTAGKHRVSLPVKTGDKVIGDDGAILSGARELTNWIQDGDYWYAPGQTQQGDRHATDQVTNLRDAYPEDLWVDGARLTHVSALNELLEADQWFLDYDSARLYIRTDPAGKDIETAVLTSALTSHEPRNVTVENLIIERYASPTQRCAIGSSMNTKSMVGLRLIDCVVRENHGGGVMLGPGCQMVGRVLSDGTYTSRVEDNGQIGLVASMPWDNVSTDEIILTGTEIKGNLRLSYSWGFEGGGSKFKYAHSMLCANNYVHDNFGPGLWWDIDNRDCTIELNTVVDNWYCNIFYEISFGTTFIRYNTLGGADRPVGEDGTSFSIDISNSGEDGGVEVSDNTIIGGQGGIIVRQADRGNSWNTKDVKVHNNQVVDVNGMVMMALYLSQGDGETDLFDNWGNQFYDNTFQTTASSTTWHNRDLQSIVAQRDWFGEKSVTWWRQNVEGA